MRAATIDISSGSKCDKNTRCSEWQLTHPPSDALCCGVPGALMISSAFDICVAIFIGRVIFVSGRSSRVLSPFTSADVAGSS